MLGLLLASMLTGNTIISVNDAFCYSKESMSSIIDTWKTKGHLASVKLWSETEDCKYTNVPIPLEIVSKIGEEITLPTAQGNMITIQVYEATPTYIPGAVNKGNIFVMLVSPVSSPAPIIPKVKYNSDHNREIEV